MQAADIFQMDLDIACAGIDQRKAHIIARESAQKLRRKVPVSLHTYLLPSLSGASAVGTGGMFDADQKIDLEIGSKMAKSIPGSAIMVHEEPEQIKYKIRSAYCPSHEAENNPVLEIVRLIIMSQIGGLEIERPAKYGGRVRFETYEGVRDAYVSGNLHPQDLKNSVAESLSRRLESVREQFKKDPELLSRVTTMEITR